MGITGLLFGAVLACCSTISQINEAALTLKFGTTTCSGTAVGRDMILTATHCIDTPLSFVDDKPVVAVETVNDGRDHSLIRVTGIQFKTWAKLGPTPKQGDPIRWIGNPAEEQDMYRVGYVVRTTKTEVLLDARIFEGDSGAGLFNKHGELVAVMSGIRWWSNGQVSLQFGSAFPLEFTSKQLSQMNLSQRL